MLGIVGIVFGMATQSEIEQFMTQYFSERTNTLRLMLEVRRPFLQRFYDPDCLYDSRKGTVERSEAETIESVIPSETEVMVVTSGTSLPNQRRRYQVQFLAEICLIAEVEVEQGCGQWRNSEAMSKFVEQHSRSTKAVSDEELAGPFASEPRVERFMTGLAQERTAVCLRETEIYGDFARRFYCPEFDWTKHVASAGGGRQEKIIGVRVTDQETLVITKGLLPFRLRHHLRPLAETWIIGEVDMECPLCFQKGKETGCISCGGTIWEKKWRK